MSYQIIPLRDGYFAVINTLTGSINSYHTTLANAKSQIRLLHMLGYRTGKTR